MMRECLDNIFARLAKSSLMATKSVAADVQEKEWKLPMSTKRAGTWSKQSYTAPTLQAFRRQCFHQIEWQKQQKQFQWIRETEEIETGQCEELRLAPATRAQKGTYEGAKDRVNHTFLSVEHLKLLPTSSPLPACLTGNVVSRTSAHLQVSRSSWRRSWSCPARCQTGRLCDPLGANPPTLRT